MARHIYVDIWQAAVAESIWRDILVYIRRYTSIYMASASSKRHKRREERKERVGERKVAVEEER